MSTIPLPGTEVEPKPWQSGLAPVYIGMFLWVAFFDQIGRRALPIGGLGWSILGAAVGGPLSYVLLFRPSASWGHRAGKPLDVVATSTFGVRGASVIPGLLIGMAQIVLFAVAIGYAIELTFQGLVIGRLVEPRMLRPAQLGGASLKAPLYLATALFWALATALVGLRFVRWIAYLMQFFPIFPAVMLGGAMLASLVGLRSFHPSGVDPLDPNSIVAEGEGAVRAFLLTLQWVFAFSAMAGVMGADWGAGSVGPRDVRLGGWVGLGLAPAIISALALIAVAGYQGMKDARSFEETRFPRPSITDLATPGGLPSTGPAAGLDAPPFTFRALLNGGFDPRLGALMFLTFGLASLAPAVYSSFVFGLQFKTFGPGISRLTWTMMGTCTAWLLIVGGWFDRTEVAFNVLGAAFAPAAGAIAADYRRHRGRWPGPRVGTNPAGLIAWGIGLAVGLAPTLGRALGSERLTRLQPAALAAFIAAFLAYELLALVRLESASVEKTT
jgi:cytosine permease